MLPKDQKWPVLVIPQTTMFPIWEDFLQKNIFPFGHCANWITIHPAPNVEYLFIVQVQQLFSLWVCESTQFLGFIPIASLLRLKQHLQTCGEWSGEVGANDEKSLHRDVRLAGPREQRHHRHHVQRRPQGGVRQQGGLKRHQHFLLSFDLQYSNFASQRTGSSSSRMLRPTESVSQWPRAGK